MLFRARRASTTLISGLGGGGGGGGGLHFDLGRSLSVQPTRVGASSAHSDCSRERTSGVNCGRTASAGNRSAAGGPVGDRNRNAIRAGAVGRQVHGSTRLQARRVGGKRNGGWVLRRQRLHHEASRAACFVVLLFACAR